MSLSDGAEVMRQVIAAACLALISQMDELNELDSDSGDGDCGSTLADGARGKTLFVLNCHLYHHSKYLPKIRIEF